MYSNIKFHENPSNGSRVVSCDRTHMMKLKIAFRNIANAPKSRTRAAQSSVYCGWGKWRRYFALR